jgi:hypothetical protein
MYKEEIWSSFFGFDEVEGFHKGGRSQKMYFPLL